MSASVRICFWTIPKGQLAQLKATLETRQPIIASDHFRPAAGRAQTGRWREKPYAEFPLVALDGAPLANVFFARLG